MYISKVQNRNQPIIYKGEELKNTGNIQNNIIITYLV